MSIGKPSQSSTDVMFVLRVLMEKHRVSHKELHCAFVGLKKEYDRVQREEL